MPSEWSEPDDSIGKGVRRAMLWQLGIIIATTPMLLVTFWGLILWIALIPLYLSRRDNNYPLAAKGVVIAGFVGILLNAGCAALVLRRSFFR